MKKTWRKWWNEVRYFGEKEYSGECVDKKGE